MVLFTSRWGIFLASHERYMGGFNRESWVKGQKAPARLGWGGEKGRSGHWQSAAETCVA